MNCHICKCQLDQPNIPESLNCGGDCLKCMAEAGDPDCIKSLMEIERERIICHYPID